MSIAELKLDDTIGAYLRDGGDATGLEELAQLLNEYRGKDGGGSGKIGEMTSKAGVYEKLLL